MLYCHYCAVEQAGVSNGLGAIYCFNCGMTICEEYLVEEVTYSKEPSALLQALKQEAAKAASYSDTAAASEALAMARKPELASKKSRKDPEDGVSARRVDASDEQEDQADNYDEGDQDYKEQEGDNLLLS